MSLKENVKEIIERNVEGLDYEEVETWFEDLRMNGCQSGMVSDMIYYTDTVKFFDDHAEEINERLSYLLGEIGVKSPVELFNGWDNDDPLCLEDRNKNLLAWWAFEAVAEELEDEILEEVEEEV